MSALDLGLFVEWLMDSVGPVPHTCLRHLTHTHTCENTLAFASPVTPVCHVYVCTAEVWTPVRTSYYFPTISLTLDMPPSIHPSIHPSLALSLEGGVSMADRPEQK